MRAILAVAAAAAVVTAVPASAALQLFTFSGTAGVAPSPSPIPELQQFIGAQLVGAFLIDTSAAVFQPVGPVGGQGEGALLTGAVIGGQVDLFGTNGPVTLLRTGNDPGNIFTVNNGGVPSNPNNRTDQMLYSSVAGLPPGGLIKTYDILGGLSPDVFISSLVFGRTQQGPFDNPPTLITDVATRDFAGVLGGPVGSPLFLSITFRQGDPTINGNFSGLPFQAISAGNLQLSVINLGGAVPEPSSWAMLIAGFGLVGAAQRQAGRRRRALAA
jgi:hypothetical protein